MLVGTQVARPVHQSPPRFRRLSLDLFLFLFPFFCFKAAEPEWLRSLKAPPTPWQLKALLDEQVVGQVRRDVINMSNWVGRLKAPCWTSKWWAR